VRRRQQRERGYIMANLSFSFPDGVKRTFFNVELKDGRKLQVKMPKKSTFSKVSTLQGFSNNPDASVDDVIDTLSALIAECLSNNLNGDTVKASEIAEDYDIEEMQQFLNMYMDQFVAGIQNEKN
jgi:hypothetical protein